MDIFEAYKIGTTKLISELGKDHPEYQESLLLQLRLLENIEETIKFGGDEGKTSRRNQIIDSLNHLALRTVNKSFNQICNLDQQTAIDLPSYQKNSHYIPPDAGLLITSAPSACPVYDLDNSNSSLFPFDLGSVWGLNRGSFIGLISSSLTNRVFETLVVTERALNDACKSVGKENQFQTRKWLRISPAPFPNGPANVSDVWSSVDDQGNPLLLDLKTKGVDGNTSIGIYLEIDCSKENDSILATLYQWARILYKTIFLNNQLILIINFSSSPKIAKQYIFELRKTIEVLKIPIDSLTTWTTPHIWSSYELQGLPVIDARGYKEGSCLYSWLSSALSNRDNPGGANNNEEKLASFGMVLEEYEKLKTNHFGSQLECSAKAVISDIELMAADLKVVFCRQFLGIIGKYLPDRISELVYACATSNYSDIRRQALIYSSKSDHLMDIWVVGMEFIEKGFPEGNELTADPIEGPFLTELVLGILRRIRRNKDGNYWLEKIRVLMPIMNRDLKRTCDLCMDILPEKVFLQSANLQELLYVFRSGYQIKQPNTIFDGASIKDAKYWWFVMAYPLHKDVLEVLISCTVEKRSIFGLCSKHEWDLTNSNKDKYQLVLDCRRNQRFSFL